MIRLHEPTFGEEEIAAVAATMRSGRVTQGPKVEEFEAAFCEKFGYRHAVACNSGSSANLLAVSALVEDERWPPGNEVIVPAVSWPTSVWPVIQHNLTPLVVDCDLETLNVDSDEALAGETLETCGGIQINVYGNVCSTALGPKYGPVAARAYLIEDCCESLGTEAGVWACISTFSFYFSHHITTMEGGMIATNDDELANIMRSQRSHGWTRDLRGKTSWAKARKGIDPRFFFPKLGYNLRITEPQAAMGLVQLPKLDGFVEKRRLAHAALRERLKDMADLILQKETPGTKASWFGFTIISPRKRKIVAALADAGVETRPIIAGNIAEQPILLRYPHRIVGSLPNARRVMREGFAIPCHHALTEADIDLMATTIKEIINV